MGWTSYELEIQFLGEEYFLFLSTASRPAPGPVLPPIQQIPGAPFPGIKQACSRLVNMLLIVFIHLKLGTKNPDHSV
jgi:hypothetical protein